MYLNDTKVYPDSNQTIRMTRENPYFTDSEAYTLEVSLPTGIIGNRRFFGNIQRIERTKQTEPMTCRLLVNNRPVLVGTARVTQVTDIAVKVQLLGGKSEVNFLSSENKDYIDELDLGYVIATRRTRGGTIDNSEDGRAEYTYSLSTGMRIKSTPVYDETQMQFRHTRQLCLVDLMQFCIEHYGFTLERNDVDIAPWNSIYIATAMDTRIIRHTLPHWTVREFLKEACNLFNVTIYTDQIQKTARIVSNIDLSSHESISITPLEEYTADLAEEESGCMANDTLDYQLSDSEHHDYDKIDEELRDTISRQNYNSRTAALQAWQGMSTSVRDKMVFSTETEGDYASWTHDFNWKDQNTPAEQFTKIDMFAPLKRGNNTKELKIVPVAMGYIYEETEREGNAVYKYWLVIPSMTNPMPKEGYGQRMGGRRGSSGSSSESDSTSVQDYIEGCGVPDKTEKEDRMQVMFVDDTVQTYGAYYTSVQDVWEEYEGTVGFTDADLKPQFAGSAHLPWSLSLNPTRTSSYIGLLHRNGYSFNTKAKISIKFAADEMPDPTFIYIVKNKRYGCEKIEANIDSNGFDRIMTGYFYEML